MIQEKWVKMGSLFVIIIITDGDNHIYDSDDNDQVCA